VTKPAPIFSPKSLLSFAYALPNRQKLRSRSHRHSILPNRLKISWWVSTSLNPPYSRSRVLALPKCLSASHSTQISITQDSPPMALNPLEHHPWVDSHYLAEDAVPQSRQLYYSPFPGKSPPNHRTLLGLKPC